MDPKLVENKAELSRTQELYSLERLSGFAFKIIMKIWNLFFGALATPVLIQVSAASVV